jgi:SPP1 gp7 family putative phage head morphogenesis protein
MPVTFVRKSVSNPINDAAANMEPKLRKAFLDAVAAMKKKVSLDKLAKAVERGNVNEALSILALDKDFADALRGKGLQAHLDSFRDAINQTVAAGAKAAVKMLPTRISTDLSFNLMSPDAVAFVDSYSFGLIHQVTQDTIEAIRDVLHRGFSEGGHPLEMAREIRDFIGLTTNQERAVANYKRALSDPSKMRTALDRALRDGRHDATVLRAVRNNAPLDQAMVDKMVARYKERYVQYRAQMIARTESIRASNVGQKEVWRQAQRQGLLDGAVRVWISSGDDRECDICGDLDGETAGMDEEFAPGILHPPTHPSCRCTTALQFS